jgi:TPR repeat protein
LAVGIAASCVPPALALAPLAWQVRPSAGSLLKASDDGIDIVRIPPRASVAPQRSESGEPPTQAPSQPQARLLKLPVKLGSQPNEAHKGWLGAGMEAVDMPLALSLGLVKADGTLILDTMAGGPAAQAGIRFGDIVIGLNGAAIANDLRDRVAAMPAGSEIVLDVWRVAGDGGDFLEVLRRLADGGNAAIMFRLGRMYANGVGTARNDAEAVRWYKMGADAGNLNAMVALSDALLAGRGTAMDQPEGLRLLKAAAARNHIWAMNRLGHILAEGKITTKDALEAARLFTRAAEAGDPTSMVDIGFMYSNGTGVQADASKAAMWYRQAADRGNTAGMVHLGWLYEHGNGVESDLAKAAMWYKRGADLGNSLAMVDLGLLYAQGRGVAKNEIEAVALYRKAAGLGNSLAMNNLAWMLQSGSGVDRKDPEEAADFMMKSLDRRNDFARERMTQYSRSWTREFRQAMQKRLHAAGFYTGRIDGEFREPTISAVNAYFNRSR